MEACLFHQLSNYNMQDGIQDGSQNIKGHQNCISCTCENTYETDQRLCFRYTVQSIYFLNPKFEACRCTTRSVSGPGRKSQCWSWIFSKRLERAEVIRGNERVLDQSFATTVWGHYHISKEGSENSGRN